MLARPAAGAGRGRRKNCLPNLRFGVTFPAMFPTCVILLLATLPLAASPLPAQSGAAAVATDPRWFVVTGEDVLLRSGPSAESSYPFGRLPAGSPLEVLETQHGWAKVRATGPTFAMIHGLVKADAAVSVDPTTGLLAVTGRTAIMAPNITAKSDPDKSWKSIATLAPGETLAVLGSTKGQRDTYWKVELPEKAIGWVSERFVALASADQVAAIEAAIAAGAGLALPEQETLATREGVPLDVSPETDTAVTVVDEKVVTTAGGVTVTEEKTVATGGGLTVTDEKVTVGDASGTVSAETITLEATPERPFDAAATGGLDAAEAALVKALTYQDLEAIWARVRRDTEESQELDVLRERYGVLANDPTVPAPIRNLARARAEQVAMRIEVQDDLRKLDASRRKLSETQQRIVDYTNANRKRLPFDAVGRLAASTVYNGDRLPLLYRLIDPTSLYTVAYVKPPAGTGLTEMLGLIVGVKGTKAYDETIRIDVIAPTTIETLSPDAERGTTASVPLRSE